MRRKTTLSFHYPFLSLSDITLGLTRRGTKVPVASSQVATEQPGERETHTDTEKGKSNKHSKRRWVGGGKETESESLIQQQREQEIQLQTQLVYRLG